MAPAAPHPQNRTASLSVAAVLLLLFAYGTASTPGLVERWGFGLDGLGVLVGWMVLAACAIPLVRESPSRRAMALLIVAGVALRLTFATLVVGHAPQGDAQSYLTIAANLRDGHGLTIVEPFLEITTRALFPPLYPVLLAGWGIGFGFSTLSLLSLHTVIDLATAAVIGVLGVRIGNAGAGRGAAWLYLIWPSALFSAPLAQKESLCALLVVILATAWAWECQPERNRKRIATIGVAAGLLALTQPGEAPLAALFGLVLIGRLGLRRILAIGIPAALVAGAVLLPWWVRNWLVLGAFVPLTTSSGVGLWIGNNPGATGNWMAPPASLRGLPEIEYSRQAGAMAGGWIAAHPVEFVRLTLTKLARSCGVGQFGLTRLGAMHPALPAWLGALLLPLSHGAHLAMLGGAAVATRVRNDRAASTVLLLVAACGLQVALFGVWFEFGERHREFATPFLLLLVCLGLSRAQSWWLARLVSGSSTRSIDHRPLPTIKR